MSDIRSQHQTFLGIEIGGTKLQLVAGRANQIVERRRFAVVESDGAEGIRRQISSALKELIDQHHACAIGVGFGGPVDWKTGSVLNSHQVHGWANFPLGEWLTSESGLPVQVDNDANAAAWAESRYGSGLAHHSIFYVTLGSGVGGGLITDDEIYHGATGGEAEIGQVKISRDGATLESFCSGWAVDQRIRNARTQFPQSLLFDLIGNETGGEARHLAVGWEKKDALACQIIDEMGATLAFALSHVVHLMHPEVIVLGGGLSLLGEPLQEAVARALPSFLMKAFQPPRIMLASLREDVVPVGALLLAENVYAGLHGRFRQK